MMNNRLAPALIGVLAALAWSGPALAAVPPTLAAEARAAIKAISEGIARTYGMPEDQLPIITMKGSSTPLVNDEGLAARMATTLKSVFGEKNVLTELPPVTGSEDVHLLRGPHKDIPFNFLFVGIADPKVFVAAQWPGEPMRVPYSGHNPNLVVDLAAITVGTSIATIAMLELLHPGAKPTGGQK